MSSLKINNFFLILTPDSEEQWKQVAEAFHTHWNFPNCIGAVGGKHVQLKCPFNSGSYYFNCKSSFSIVSLVLVDADYKFLYVDVGCNGRIRDGGDFRNSSLSNALTLNTLNIALSDSESLPYVVVADDTFPLKTYMMKPYAFKNLCTEKRVFIYHLSRARRVVENAFGILANRFRIFLMPIAVVPETAVKIVLASCVLHNFLRRESSNRYTYQLEHVILNQ